MPFWTGNENQNVYTPLNIPTPNPNVYRDVRLKYVDGALTGLADEGGTVLYPGYPRDGGFNLRDNATNFQLMSGTPLLTFGEGGYTFFNVGGGTGSFVPGTINPTAALLTTGGAANDNTAVRRTSGANIVLAADDVLTLVVDSASFTNNDQIRLEFSSDGFVAKSALLTHVLKTVHGNRVYIAFRAGDATLNGGELITNTMSYVGIRLTKAASTGAASVRVLGVYRNAIARPKIIIEFDDAFASQYTEVFRYMSQFGLAGNISVIERTVGQPAGGVDAFAYCSLSQLQEMYAAGWDMTTHGYYNHDSFANRAALLADVTSNLAYLRGTGMSRAASNYIYPGGVVSTSNDTIGVLGQLGLTTGRTIEFNSQATAPLGVSYRYGLWSRTISDAAGPANLLAAVDHAINTGGTVRLHGHRVVASVVDNVNEISITNFRTLIDGIVTRIRDGKIDAVTISEWARRINFTV